MPRFSAEGSSRIVSVLGVGLSSKMFYNPKLKRQFECKFEAQGGSSSKLPSTRGTVVKSRDPMDVKDFFYDIACPVPEVNQAPADFKLSVSCGRDVLEVILSGGSRLLLPLAKRVLMGWEATACVKIRGSVWVQQ